MGITSWLRSLFGGDSGPRPATPDPADFASLPEALSAFGYGEVADLVAAGPRTTVLLGGVAGDEETVGRTKVGGRPLMPPSLEWPACAGVSLAFIAQVDLEGISALWPDSPLPANGLLLFFYDAEQSVWGFDPADRGKWAVLHVADEPLEPRAFPDDLPDHARYRERVLTPSLGEDLPDPTSFALEELGLKRWQIDEIFDICDPFLAADDTIHKMLGYADPMQNPMEKECQLVSHGLYCGDASGSDDPRAEELGRDAEQWKLLLQVSTDDAAGMMWGDCGRIYFWIREQDLAAGDFTKVWLILQCA